MQTMSDGGGSSSTNVSSGVTVPLMVQPAALAATAARFDDIADKLETWLGGNQDKLHPTAAGNDEVSRIAALEFALQSFSAVSEIKNGIAQLHAAAVNLRTSAQQYQQNDALPA